MHCPFCSDYLLRYTECLLPFAKTYYAALSKSAGYTDAEWDAIVRGVSEFFEFGNESERAHAALGLITCHPRSAAPAPRRGRSRST